eukprot:CAMPEP_0167767374 /NCGR_PEP_ID=MMETSP0110_2-20121227/16014_1 /TAXON_ID=629695 /ORGANISM="Gymnochlora sp., Strain CCMP2014" /LENGTH=487 /DNA_ID=CAMNT_0007655805 /DNA_START=273 /DNA_END=1736 /DNA_ORIENTATION=+
MKLSVSLSKCRNLVQSLLKHKHGWVFREPVDPVKLNIPTYHNIITKPMDLGTIKSKLLQGVYMDVDEFGADVRLVWSNAIKFNGKTSGVSKMAMELSSYFEERFRKIQRGPFIRQSSKKKKMKRKPDPEVSIELTKLKREMDAMRKKINKYSSKKGMPKPSKFQPLKYEEKHKLRRDILSLEPGMLQTVVEIIGRRMPQLHQNDEDEMEIDIDQLDIPTLRELQQFVRNINARKQNKTPRRATPQSSYPKSPSVRNHHAAPLHGGGNASLSSSESESSDSDSESESSDSDAMQSTSSRPQNMKASDGKKKPKATFGDPSLYSSTSIVPGAANSDAHQTQNSKSEDVKMNSDAWSNFGAAPEQQNSRQNSTDDKLWADFQQKSLEQKQKREEEQKLAREAAKAREIEYSKMRKDEEEAERIMRQKREEEDSLLKKQAEEADRERARDLEARREAARRAREASLADVDLESQRAAIGLQHGSMADLLGK